MRKKYSSKAREPGSLDEIGETSTEIVPDSGDEAIESLGRRSSRVLSRAIYRTFYAVSFGAVFSSLLVERLLIPKNSVVEKGLRDGAAAARKAIEEKEALFAEVAEQTAEILSEAEPTAASA